MQPGDVPANDDVHKIHIKQDGTEPAISSLSPWLRTSQHSTQNNWHAHDLAENLNRAGFQKFFLKRGMF